MVTAYLQAGNATRSPPPPPPPSVRRPCPAAPLHPRPAAASQARQPQRAGQTRLQAAVEGCGRGHARMGQPWSGGSRRAHRRPCAGTPHRHPPGCKPVPSPTPSPPGLPNPCMAALYHAWSSHGGSNAGAAARRPARDRRSGAATPPTPQLGPSPHQPSHTLPPPPRPPGHHSSRSEPTTVAALLGWGCRNIPGHRPADAPPRRPATASPDQPSPPSPHLPSKFDRTPSHACIGTPAAGPHKSHRQAWQGWSGGTFLGPPRRRPAGLPPPALTSPHHPPPARPPIFTTALPRMHHHQDSPAGRVPPPGVAGVECRSIPGFSQAAAR